MAHTAATTTNDAKTRLPTITAGGGTTAVSEANSAVAIREPCEAETTNTNAAVADAPPMRNSGSRSERQLTVMANEEEIAAPSSRTVDGRKSSPKLALPMNTNPQTQPVIAHAIVGRFDRTLRAATIVSDSVSARYRMPRPGIAVPTSLIAYSVVAAANSTAMRLNQTAMRCKAPTRDF